MKILSKIFQHIDEQEFEETVIRIGRHSIEDPYTGLMTITVTYYYKKDIVAYFDLLERFLLIDRE